jgi:hypothetical protein
LLSSATTPSVGALVFVAVVVVLVFPATTRDAAQLVEAAADGQRSPRMRLAALPWGEQPVMRSPRWAAL